MPEEFIQKDGYQVHTRWNDMLFGGSAQVGQVDLTYDEIVSKLGEPLEVNGRYIEHRWLIRFDNRVDAKGRALVGIIWTHQHQEGFFVSGFSEENLNAVKELFGIGVVS